MSRPIAIIPARLGSTRFPRKVLADRTGKPLIQHVCENARRASCLARIVVAADDQSVARAVTGAGFECVLTRADHPNGTSRLAEAAAILGLAPQQIVVNVQGDEPELEPELIDAPVAMLSRTGAEIATAAVPLSRESDARNSNIVKVVLNARGMALYFSRSRIPFDRDGTGTSAARALRHVGIYVYRASTLATYAALPPAPLEHVEQLEQLRALHHGWSIAVAALDIPEVFGPDGSLRAGIDTPEQYDAFVARATSR
jgi:3-deoxy-manno-octulosonate cytidylyltransferase (CMP-KDO synthetase)